MKCKFFALAALLLGLASCQQDFDAQVQVGNEVDFRLTIDAPDITRAGDEVDNQKAGMNSAYGAIDYLQGAVTNDDRIDWGDVDLRYSLEVYDATGNYTDATPVKDRQVIIVDEYNPVTFELRLIPNRKYHFVVFADFVPQGATVEDVNEEKTMLEHQSELGLCHTIGENLRDITIKNDAINDERADAYFATSDIEITNSASQDIELKRPYGKLRVIATDLDQLNLNIEPAKISVKYYAKHPVAFNAVTGEIDTNVEEVTLTFESEYRDGVCKEDLTNHFYTEGYDDYELFGSKNANGVERHTHMTLFTDYILAEEEQNSIHFDIEVFDGKNAPIKKTEFCTDIPVQRNHLTTIIGNVLTTATEIDVTINDNFEDETVIDKDVIDENTIVANSLDDLMKWAYKAANTSESPNLVLTADIQLPGKTIVADHVNKTYTFTGEDIFVENGIPSGNNWPVISDYETSKNAETGVYEYYGGVIDGYGHTISGLRINHDLVASGFLCWTKGAKVDNLTFDDAVVYNKGGNYDLYKETYTGIVIGRCWDGSHVNDCHIKNSSVLGKTEVGGIVGRVYRRTIKTNTPDGQPQNLMERMAYVTYCTTDNNSVVKGEKMIGGIVGMNYGAIVGQCVNNADVFANDIAGGVAGYTRSYTAKSDGYIIGCKSSADATITSDTYAGGIVGQVFQDTKHYYTRSWVVGCASESQVVAAKPATMIGYSSNATITACWAVKNGANVIANDAKYAYTINDASFQYDTATDATQADIDAMNAAIEAFNASPDNISIDGTSGAVMLKRWALVNGVPVLQ